MTVVTIVTDVTSDRSNIIDSSGRSENNDCLLNSTICCDSATVATVVTKVREATIVTVVTEVGGMTFCTIQKCVVSQRQ